MTYPTSVSLSGAPDEMPLIRIEFHDLESWNDILASTRHPQALEGLIKKLRKKGMEKALRDAPKYGMPLRIWSEFEVSARGKTVEVEYRKIAEPIAIPVKLLLRFWRPTAHRFDVFSPAVKPVVDGFVDAGLLHDDNVKWVPEWTTRFAGIDPTLKLSDEAKGLRKAKAIGRKKAGLTASRFWFEFYPDTVNGSGVPVS